MIEMMAVSEARETMHVKCGSVSECDHHYDDKRCNTQLRLLVTSATLLRFLCAKSGRVHRQWNGGPNANTDTMYTGLSAT